MKLFKFLKCLKPWPVAYPPPVLPPLIDPLKDVMLTEEIWLREKKMRENSKIALDKFSEAISSMNPVSFFEDNNVICFSFQSPNTRKNYYYRIVLGETTEKASLYWGDFEGKEKNYVAMAASPKKMIENILIDLKSRVLN